MHILINGVMYYGATVYVGDGIEVERKLMSLDVRSEKFNQIKLPEGYYRKSCYMIDTNGRIIAFLTLSEMDLIRKEKPSFYGVSDAGEIVFAPSILFESFYLLYFDPRRNSIREVSVEGIVGDEFRSRYGFVKDYMYNMKVYPNHIKSLVFL
ncbi:putative F-box associated domain, type 3 [Arabidopsis thaliana]|uniref:F-box associated beta-propeller type 3 domain-containing protein n=3 Tax=Arabidopsis TaxID=3701 RepID=A0A178WHP0_ARATH|nr:F-box associated domain type 3 [Arabidopsis thaliana x Arabidopsis arenosa]OAP16993.1 hypothetical protein AXX17_AT1G52770 [Arabidopsis thaliana]